MIDLLGLAAATQALLPVRRVPAEWEPQAALWLQWPGPFEQTYVPAYAEIAKLVATYQPLFILYDRNQIRLQARNAITNAGTYTVALTAASAPGATRGRARTTSPCRSRA